MLDSAELAYSGMGLDSVLVLSHICHKKAGWGEQVKEMSLGSYLVCIYSDMEFALTLLSLPKKVLIYLIYFFVCGVINII